MFVNEILKKYYRCLVIFSRFFYLYKFFLFLNLGKKIPPIRGVYNSTVEQPERAKLLLENIKKQIFLYKKNIINNKKPKKKGGGRKFICLEVGSYIGSSTIILGNALNELLGDQFILFSVDPFIPYKSKNEKEFGVIELSKHIEKIYFYFLYNISKFSWRKNFIHLRNDMNQATLFSNYNIYFDFIYIDGSHYYQDVKNDLNNCSKLIYDKKDYKGLICGDDLEYDFKTLLNFFQNDENKLNKFLDNSLKYDQIKFRGKYLHPGVTKALHEYSLKYSKKVNSKNGFWYI
jgi:hypothetical protein